MPIRNKDISVIIPAAGTGKRLGGQSKIFIRLKDQPILLHIINKFTRIPGVGEIIIAVNEREMQRVERLVYRYPQVKLVRGGKERSDSVRNALSHLDPTSKIILIHDVARPLVRTKDVISLIKAVRQAGSAILAVPVIDTIKRVDEHGQIKETPKRSELWAAQTPQGFRRNILINAYNQIKSLRSKSFITDDASLVERLGLPVKIIRGRYTNLKITTPEDIITAKNLLNFTKV